MAVGGQRHSRTWYDTGSGGLSLGRRRTTTFMGTQHAHGGWSRRVGLAMTAGRSGGRNESCIFVFGIAFSAGLALTGKGKRKTD